MPTDKDTCSRIWSCLCLHSLTGVCLHSQSEEVGMTTNTLHSVKCADFSFSESITHILAREILVFALRFRGNML
jgi:hypothetical protein